MAKSLGTASQNKQLSPWEALANAIIVQAASDFRKYAAKLKHCDEEENILVKGKMDKIRSFFRGRWICVISDVDGPMILAALEKEAE